MHSTPSPIAYASGGSFGGGDGTADTPYIVEDAADMAAVANDLTKCYKLANDIDLNGSSSNPWTPIGDMSNQFTGTFDGNGYTISGLFVSAVDAQYFNGLFGIIGENGTVKNLTVSGEVAGYSDVGGVAGLNDGTLENCCNSANVSGANVEEDDSVGGLTGVNTGTISKCYNTGSLSAQANQSKIGGIAGENGGTIRNCYNIGSISATSDTIEHSEVGGLIGVILSETECIVINCYNYGSVSAKVTTTNYSGVGGVVGHRLDENTVATITACYYLEGTVNNGNGGVKGADVDGQAAKLTADEFKTQSIFTSAGWDFSGTWYMGDVRPLLGVSAKNYTNTYYLHVPSALNITNSGWNESAGAITASADVDDFDPAKSLVVTLTSSPELTPENPRNFDTIPYAIANIEAKTTPVTSWTISADALTQEGGFTQQIGAWVGDFSSKRPDSYSANVTFSVEVQ